MYVSKAHRGRSRTASRARLPREFMCRTILVALFALTHGARAIAVPLEAVPIGMSHLNVESAEFVGSGSEVTYLVIDFRAAGGGSYAFGYRHDGSDTGEDMLSAFDSAGVLEIFLEDFSFGPAVRGIAYPREAKADIFPGSFDGPRSWILWDGAYDGAQVAWSTANVGINGVEFGNTQPSVFLSDGGFYGLSTSPDFPGPAPLVPLPGDFNSDGVVDGTDLLRALWGFGTTSGPTLALGDADRDGDVDRDDVLLWRDNVGVRIPPPIGAAHVPEPDSLRLAVSLGWLLALFAMVRRLS